MFKFLLLAFVLAILVGTVLVVLMATMVFLAMACAIGIPLWLCARNWNGRREIGFAAPNPMDRLKNLYVEGKIDLFEFERRVARLIAVEQ